MIETRLRSVRVPDELWRAAQERARNEGESVSAVIVRALEAYTKSARPLAAAVHYCLAAHPDTEDGGGSKPRQSRVRRGRGATHHT